VCLSLTPCPAPCMLPCPLPCSLVHGPSTDPSCRGESGYLRFLRRGPWRPSKGLHWEGIYSASQPTLARPSRAEAAAAYAAAFKGLPACPAPSPPPPAMRATVR